MRFHTLAGSAALLVGCLQARAQDREAALARLCEPLVTARVVVGCTVGVIDGEHTMIRGFGRVDSVDERTPDGHTLYEIGSISKVFTGLLLADAAERGVVQLDDPAQKWLPDDVTLPTRNGTAVLLRHLSSHTSGLPRLLPGAPPDPADPYRHLSADVLLRAVDEVELRREPGTDYEYSNLGTGLLGHLLVRANDAASFDALLRQVLCAPLGLGDTVVQLDPAQQARLAPPFDADGEPAHTWDLAALAGAGGIRSTVVDLLTFARAQWQASGPLRAAIARSHTRLYEGERMAVAYGWHRPAAGPPLFHTGQTGGYHGYLAVDPTQRRAVCILANTGTGAIDTVGHAILRHLKGERVEPPAFAVPVDVDRQALATLVGTYRRTPGNELVVTLRASGLFAQLTGQAAFLLHARSPDEFFCRVVTASIIVERDGDTVAALVLHQDGRRLRFARLPAPAGR